MSRKNKDIQSEEVVSTKKSRKSEKKAKKTSVNAANYITSKIPYLRCYEELGMFEIEPHKYSVTYEIVAPDELSGEQYVKNVAYGCMENILVALKGFTFRFTIRNSHVSADEYLKSVMLPEDKDATINDVIHDYNNVLKENVNIGHNNFKMSLYLTIVTDAEVPDDALESFKSIEETLVSEFKALYGYDVKLLSLSQRLEVLYDIYHPDADSPAFGSKVDYDGNGFSIASMKRMKMNTKDVIVPKFYEAKELNYFRLGDKFGRMLFINSIPAKVSDSLLSDLISISSNSMLSVTYQPIDADFGFNTSANLVKSNIEVRNISIRDTIEDRKKHRIERKETMIKENEEEYFNKAALNVFTDSAAKGQPVMLTTFVVALFSDTLEDLERDTTLLKISASKYACPIKPFDLQQHEAFVSVLPLGSMKVDVPRLFNVERLSKLLPVNIQSLFEREVTLQGLNEINDNFVLIDRRNYPLGLIAGMKTSGKSFAVKREAVNTLMTTNDTVIIVAPKPKNKVSDYESFVKSLNGDVFEPILTDLFSADDDYGLTVSRASFKKMFLETFMTLKLGFHKKRYTSEELQTVYDEVSKEAAALCEYDDYVDAVTYARNHGTEFKLFNKVVANYIPTSEYPDFANARLNLVYFGTPSELLLQVDYLWNYAIAMKKANQNVWIYIDGIDEFVYSPVASDYLMSLLDKCKTLKVPVTMTVQDSAKIVSNDTAKIEFDYLLEKVEYFKLLSQGVIERRKFVDKLGIPQTLVPYITDVEPSEGIIITPSVNVAFNDRFETSENPFYQRFKTAQN